MRPRRRSDCRAGCRNVPTPPGQSARGIFAVDFDLREDPPVDGQILIAFNSDTHGFDLASQERADQAKANIEKERLMELIGDGWPNGNRPITRKELAKLWKVGLTNVRKHLDRLEAAGRVIKGPMRGKAKTYQLSAKNGDTVKTDRDTWPESLMGVGVQVSHPNGTLLSKTPVRRRGRGKGNQSPFPPLLEDTFFKCLLSLYQLREP